MAHQPKISWVGAGLIHPSVRVQRVARRVFDDLAKALTGGPLTRTWCRSGTLGTTLRSVVEQRPSCVIVLAHHAPPDATAVGSLRDYVSRGGVFVALHGMTASFKTDAEYEDLIGARFAGHGRIGPIEMSCTADEAPALRRITVRDEPYVHVMRPDIDVVCSADGIGPLVWCRRFGEGTVVVVVPGHRASTFRNAELREIVRKIVTTALPGITAAGSNA